MRLRIDNIEVEVEKGETILDCAKKSGIAIPTLCHRDGIGHYSTCMVCMVKDKRKDTFIPSCSALAQDEMDIDASGDEVLKIRKKAVELLLSEHRAECEAQCRIVCPGGYNIPLMNRLLMAGKIEEAAELSLLETDGNELRCLTCPAYCENACRRKKIDEPVSIRNIKIFVYNNLITRSANNTVSYNSLSEDIRKRFSSRIGRIEDTERSEWLKECKDTITRFREISDLGAASGEAESCMHCDCRAAQNCKLRDIAEKFDIKDPKGKFVNAPISKKINKKTGLIFENAKCIKCGLCVRICEDSIDEPGLCFINRGFVSIISEPLTQEFDDLLSTKTDIVVDVCPTGALGHFKNI
jgi:ferredoxin